MGLDPVKSYLQSYLQTIYKLFTQCGNWWDFPVIQYSVNKNRWFANIEKKLTSKTAGSHRSLVPLTSKSDEGPLPTSWYKNSLNQTELTSGMAGPR